MKSKEQDIKSPARKAAYRGRLCNSLFDTMTALAAMLVVAAVGLSLSCRSAPKDASTAPFLQGVVFDLDKTPVAGALIELEGCGMKLHASTDAQGRFSFGDVELGDYEITFSKQMYEKLSRRIEVRDFTEVLYIQAAGYWQLLDAALSALGSKDLGRAEEYLNRARTIQETSSTALFLEGVLSEKRGDYSVALRKLEEATAIDPRSAYLWLYLADLCERSGADPTMTITALEKYLVLRDDPAAAARLADLRGRNASEN